jgi:hypothetical protein
MKGLTFLDCLSEPLSINLSLNHAHALQGTLNCVSAGILIYMALVQMVAVDFAPESLALLKNPWSKVGVYFAFFVGAGCMSFLVSFRCCTGCALPYVGGSLVFIVRKHRCDL